MFSCDKCGLCCMHIDTSPLSAPLDRGDGVCKFFEEDSKLCSIYEKRPILCNVDKAYHAYYRDKLTIKDFYQLNYAECKRLKEKYRIK